MIPAGSNYPNQYDTEVNLHSVQDSLSVTLQRDYQPGDSMIWIDGDISLFPSQGIITLTDHDPNKVNSLYYHGKSSNTFTGLEPTQDMLFFKPRKLTTVSQQIRAEHHNAIVDAIIAIEKAIGTKHDTGETITGRLNTLQKILSSPKAWFEVSKSKGVVPFTVIFKSLSSGDKLTYEWDFGDGVKKTGSREQEKTYNKPGIYDVSLRIVNSVGEDTVTLTKFIEARGEAPAQATIKFVPQDGQIITKDSIRTLVNQPITIEVQDTGEHKNDPITSYTWFVGDDLPHNNSPNTKAEYSIGGLHDLTLRVDTLLGAYRITNYQNCIDVVENQNLWLWTKKDQSVQAHEFGMNNETFKVKNGSTQRVATDSSFLTTARQKQEFDRNTGWAARNKSCLLFWALPDQINFVDFDGFKDIYQSVKPIYRPWNWASFVSSDKIYFILGTGERTPPTMSPTNQGKTSLSLGNLAIKENVIGNYINGAQELMYNPAVFNEKGAPIHGHFSIYRTAWKAQTGYLMRNSSANGHLRNFYKTDGIMSDPFMDIVKLPDIPGAGKAEGNLVALSKGIFFFSNSGDVKAFNDTTGSWESKPGSPSFRALQDHKTLGYENETNSLLASSDGDRKAYLSFDYSEKAFVKFNEADLTFSSLGKRPMGKQWLMAIY